MPPERGTRAQLVLAAAAVLLAAADTYVVVLALPDIMKGVGLDSDELGRAAPIISVFLLGYVAVLPLVGRIADLSGRLPVIAGCLLLFAVGSLVTATADGIPAAVTGRGLQGVGAGGLVPATLALVADIYPAERRGVPLGAVGAAQEAGAVLGPLYGALVLAVADWRAIFWVNLVAGLVLAVALAVSRRTPGTPRLDWIGVALFGLAAGCLTLLLVAPDRYVDDIDYGRLWTPHVGESRATSWLAIATYALTALALVRAATAPPTVRAVPPVRALPRLLRAADLPGAALLGLALGGIVLAFAGADAEKRAVSPAAPELLVGSALCLVGFVIRERHTDHPLIPMGALSRRPAWGGLVVSVFVGAALVAVLVDVPVFARVTGDDQLGAALLLLRMLVAVPVGALLGGWAVRRWGPALVTATGMGLVTLALLGMSQWGRDASGAPLTTIELAVAGLGFGLAVAPVNAAVLAASDAAIHGLASALVVVARTVGMLVGLSALTALGLRKFANAAAEITSPLITCPDSPNDCQPYKDAVRAAAISEVHAVLVGAVVCAALATVGAAVLLGRRTA